mmetsp:Transcript_33967/g.30732  ORF Transcript_33967/g.30732 Transcript_33967/m.30732 type:complete len:101 (+) Transcript_33967:1942-2244(+)
MFLQPQEIINADKTRFRSPNAKIRDTSSKSSSNDSIMKGSNRHKSQSRNPKKGLGFNQAKKQYLGRFKVKERRDSIKIRENSADSDTNMSPLYRRNSSLK